MWAGHEAGMRKSESAPTSSYQIILCCCSTPESGAFLVENVVKNPVLLFSSESKETIVVFNSNIDQSESIAMVTCSIGVSDQKAACEDSSLNSLCS